MNGVKYGGRLQHETPEEGGSHRYPKVDLYTNDEIRVGGTTLLFEVQQQRRHQIARCQQCGQDLPGESGPGQNDDGLCFRCRTRMQHDPITPLLPLFAKTPDHRQGLQLADYYIQKKLGEGGMGAVYLLAPKGTVQSREIALKVMSAKTVIDPQARRTFLREIENTKALEHPNIVRFLGNGVEKNTFYFLLEYCQGGNLSSLIDLRGGHLTLAEARPIMLQSLQGLAYAHRKGVVHRDIKPHNILLNPNRGYWQAKIADFGLAKNFIDAGWSGMTISGEGFAGSLLFMAREQLIDFKYTKPESDVWSLGATFYYMLTGKFPRPNKPGIDPAEIILYEKAIPLRQADPHIASELTTIIDRALAFDPKDRYQTAYDMLDPLTRLLS